MIAPPDSAPPALRPSFGEAARAFARIAALSFGGPAGQIAVLHRILVVEKRWLTERRFLDALNVCMLLPGPEAQQLATYSGWALLGVRGGLLAGALFILPGFAALMALSFVYALWGAAGFVAALLFGLKAGVLPLVAQAALRLADRVLADGFARALALAAFIALFFFRAPFPLVVGAAGLIGLAARRTGAAAAEPEAPPPPGRTRAALRAGLLALALWLAPAAALAAFVPGSVYDDIAIFFSKIALATFGGAYAILAYVAQEAVETRHWLSAGEMLDGLGMAETTPGPLVMVLQFVGFMAAWRAPAPLSPLAGGALGGVLASWATFAPSFALVFFAAPFIERLRSSRALASALAAISAATVGVIANLSLWLTIRCLFREIRPVAGFGLSFEAPVISSLDWPALAICAGAAFALFRLRAGAGAVLAGAAAAGLLFRAAA